MTPSAFIFLYENHLFLTFRNRTVAVWNFGGELVTSFEDHLLWHPDCNTNNIYITSDQDLIISYCKAEQACEQGEGQEGKLSNKTSQCLQNHSLYIPLSLKSAGTTTTATVTPVGSINMSNIMTGKCIAKICADDPQLQINRRTSFDTGRRSTIHSTIREALEDVTALFYDEERNEIYTGNKHGLVHVWSN